MASRCYLPIIYSLVLSHPGVAPKIQDYGAIGDCRTVALVSRYGSIDWLCWPSFDCPPIFAALLDRDKEKAGYWAIAPVAPRKFEHAYVRDSNVLETRFMCESGSAVLTDLMPVASEAFKRQSLVPDHELLRQVTCAEGQLEIEMRFCPRSGYESKPVKMRNNPWGWRMDVGRGIYTLRSSIPLVTDQFGARAKISLRQGDVLQFSLT